MAASTLTHLGNELVVAVLHSPFHALLDRRTALLTITGCRSGRSFTFPVEYSRDGRVLHVISRTDHRWWRNLASNGHISIRLGGWITTRSARCAKWQSPTGSDSSRGSGVTPTAADSIPTMRVSEPATP